MVAVENSVSVVPGGPVAYVVAAAHGVPLRFIGRQPFLSVGQARLM